MYTAKVAFVDLKDDRHFYNAGDTFPREGLSVDAARIAELAGSDNRMGYPLIEAVPEPQKRPLEAEEAPDKEIPESGQKPAKKRRAARRRGDNG